MSFFVGSPTGSTIASRGLFLPRGPSSIELLAKFGLGARPFRVGCFCRDDSATASLGAEARGVELSTGPFVLDSVESGANTRFEGGSAGCPARAPGGHVQELEPLWNRWRSKREKLSTTAGFPSDSRETEASLAGLLASSTGMSLGFEVEGRAVHSKASVFPAHRRTETFVLAFRGLMGGLEPHRTLRFGLLEQVGKVDDGEGRTPLIPRRTTEAVRGTVLRLDR